MLSTSRDWGDKAEKVFSCGAPLMSEVSGQEHPCQEEMPGCLPLSPSTVFSIDLPPFLPSHMLPLPSLRRERDI